MQMSCSTPLVAATVIGEQVQLPAAEEGGSGFGLPATFRRNGRTGTVALVDVVIDEGADTELARALTAYRRWLAGLGPAVSALRFRT